MTAARRPTIADVASLAGVDRSVVSRVLNDDPVLRVRDDTRARVLEAVDKLGYRRNVAAQSLRAKRANAIGLVIPTYDNPVFTAIIDGAASEATDRGAFLLTASLAMLGTVGESPIDLLATGRVDALLLAGHDIRIPVGALTHGGAPVLTINRRIPDFDRWVVLHDEEAVAIAVSHLADLGHRHIAHIAGPPDADTALRRREGFLAATDTLGIQRDQAPIIEADYTAPGGAAATRVLLEQRSSLPTAIVAANVASAVGALHALRDAQRRVPEDVSVIAIHDSPFAGYLEPPLTVVGMPLFELGRRAVEILIERAPDEVVNEVVSGPMTLIERASTGPPRPGSGDERR